MSGKDVAASLGTSEPTVSRRLAKVRDALRARLAEVIETFSFTEDERREAERNGLVLAPNNADDALFDEAVADLFLRESEARTRDQQAWLG
jgi:DNA-binding LacI/PurR family transcriptional regulator